MVVPTAHLKLLKKRINPQQRRALPEHVMTLPNANQSLEPNRLQQVLLSGEDQTPRVLTPLAFAVQQPKRLLLAVKLNQPLPLRTLHQLVQLVHVVVLVD
uniref:(northern house mosquito) hypothetical protein n=1 Tax=Culex pipiens TaxID=7175 RepID=A0A8D8F366_CULPI